MVISCPSCSSEYQIDAGRVAPAGRTVRCAKCRETWFASVAPDAEPDAESTGSIGEAAPPVIDGPSAIRPPAGRRPAARGRGRPARREAGPRYGLAAAAAVAVLLAAPAAIAFRAPLVRAAPESAAVFAAIGLPVNLVGLDLVDVQSSVGEEEGRKVLLIEGTIRNTGGRDLAIPPLALSLDGEGGAPLYAWTSRAARPDLAAGQSQPFRVRLASPPPLARHVTVTFADPARPVASR